MIPQHNNHTNELYGVIESRLSTIRVLLYDIAENCESAVMREIGVKEAYNQVKGLEEWCGSLQSFADQVNNHEVTNDK